jgi:protein-export membrane protein SecD/preprotein translocase SecF subunit
MPVNVETGPAGTSVRNRLFVIAAVVALSLWAIYPPRENVKLGLDLNGGVHLVLRVKTDEALQLQTHAIAERLRHALTQQRVAFSGLDVTRHDEFTTYGIHDPASFRNLAAEAETVFDRVERDGTHTFRLKPGIARDLALDTVQQALHTIERRVNQLGVAEPVVARYTEHDQILVELPGVADVDRAKQIIKSTAQLKLTLIDRGPFPDRTAALQVYGNALPPALEVLPGPADTGGTGPSSYYVVHKAPAASGSDLRDARQTADEFNRPAVGFTLKEEAARRFGAFTERNVNRALATVLDGRVTSVATILSRIDGHGQIAGLSHDEMIEQVITFKAGALPADLEYVEEHTIGASLGEASIRSGVLASVGGLTLVMLFVVGYYRLAGLNAVISIALNLLILLAFVALIPVTVTLPGIAGLILTIGMGVDSNVLIFERIREELGNARGARAAVRAGFDRVWITIVDTHVTSLIAAAFLFQFGTSSIRGFATTLTIGLVANIFTSVFVSRTLFDLVLRHRRTAPHALSLSSRATGFTDSGFNFTRWGVPAILLSLVIIGAGVMTAVTRGLQLGIDFAGGTLVIAEFAEPGVTEGAVRDALSPLPGDEVVQRYGPAGERRFLIRLPLAEGTAQSTALETGVRRVTHALREATLPAFQIVERELVSAAIGQDLQRRGIYATVASIVAITLYIGLRFRLAFAVGAIAATFHDVLVTVACLSLAGYDLSLNVTAALLTVVGYSVNDTIVIFDRVRENARVLPGQPLASLVNLSVRQTLARTVITAGTTLLSVLSLYLFGGDALRGFAFTMLVGIVSGTWSTVFIASAIATRLSRQRGRRPSRATARPVHDQTP